MLRIGELAERTGVSVRALRYYEEQGLLAPVRTTGGQRRYPDDAADHVTWIRRLLAAGLSSRTILALLPCVAAGHADPAVHERLREERTRLDDHIAALVATRARLDELIEDAHRSVPAA